MRNIAEKDRNIGKRLRDLRRSSGISINDVVSIVGMFSWKELFKIENGIDKVNKDYISQFAHLYNTTPEYIVDGVKEGKE